ncbi:hypothetical protein BKA24_002370 [Microbacterium marinum]|uniref:Uncharacterized protein n=1 Tax=Microbacterium marinum TaxID=421115 RepID=A0A7W7BRU5_9MICO|nr:hypothetical protein [Microbacterium marinum]
MFTDLAEDDIDGGDRRIVRDHLKEVLQKVVGGSGFRCECDRVSRVTRPPCASSRSSNRVQREFSLAEQNGAGVGEGHAATVPVEEPDPEALLELPDRSGERRLRHPQQIGGATEMQFLRDSDEITQLAGL